MKPPQVWASRSLCALAFTLFFFTFYFVATSWYRVGSHPIERCGKPIEKGAIPRSLIYLLLSQEDILFFDHRGVDWESVRYSAGIDIEDRRLTRGASTIAMQVSSLCYRPGMKKREKSAFGKWIRKLQEVSDAYLLELHSTRGEILRAYLTVVPMGTTSRGQQIEGFQAAAREYFHRELGSLKIREQRALVSALLNPVTFHPVRWLSSLPPSEKADQSFLNLALRVHDHVLTTHEKEIDTLSYVGAAR